MADEAIDLDELLKQLKGPKRAEPSNAPAHEVRPFQTLCADAVRAYGNSSLDAGEAALGALQDEVADAGVSPGNAPSAPAGGAYAGNRAARLRLLETMYKECLSAVTDAKGGVAAARDRAKAYLRARESTAAEKRRTWEAKAGEVSRERYAEVTGRLRRVETDWAALVAGNERLEPLQGGAAEDPVHRLETAKTLGTDASESTFARARDYGRAKRAHESVEWRLADTVRHVTEEYLARSRATVEHSLRALTQATIEGAKARIRKAVADYNVGDAGLRHEGIALEAQAGPDAAARADQKALAFAEHVENDFRVRLKKALK